MARAKITKKRKPEPEPTLSVRPAVQLSEHTPVYYVNHAELMSSVYEFGVVFARLPIKPGVEQMAEAQQSGVLTVDAELQVLLPPALIPGLIRALTSQRDQYEAIFGPIADHGANQ